MEEFFKVLLFGYELELKNRFLRVGQEYGTKPAEAITGLHRQDVAVKGRDVVVNVVANVAINLTIQEENAVKCLLRDSKITAAALARQLEVSSRQAQRIISSLKVKVGLKRRGADKNGEWYFE